MTTATKTTFTPDELLNIPDSINYELVDGQLVERKMGSESSLIAGIIITILNNFTRGKKRGFVFSNDCGYQCFPDAPDKVRKPDISFIKLGRLPSDLPPQGYVRIAPDLAVEVISPNDLAAEIEEKVAEYLAAGVRLVWIVHPKLKSVRIHRATSGAATVLTGNDKITGEDVLGGFECEVAEFFRI